jgi:pimeloyl-ACP methyl ester carboxylesterase
MFYGRPWWMIGECARAWLKLAGVRSECVQLGPYRLHYYVGGQGPPLLLLHGLGARAENWSSLMVACTRHGHQVYALDLLGFGRSDRPDVDYSIALQTQVLEQFLDSRRLERADLGGWSMGGWVALKFALDHPQRVRRIFVIDSAGLTFSPAFEPAIFAPASVDEAQQLLRLITPRAAFVPRFVARDFAREMRRQWPVVHRAMESMTAGSDLLDGKLSAISRPTLIVWGKLDALIPLGCGEEMHREMPQSRLVIFDGAGHMLPTENSGRLAREALGFLEAEPPLPPGVREVPE